MRVWKGRRFENILKCGIFGLKRFSNWRYDWRIVATKQQASKLPVYQHLACINRLRLSLIFK
jgi:hypothetical protein